MKRRTREWIEKAEGDRAVALREMQAAEPVFDVVSFHAQQCAEKYLKAFLEEQGISFGKTHDLALLLDLAGAGLAELGGKKDALKLLSVLGIAARYPGSRADRAEAQDAIALAQEVRNIVRGKLRPEKENEG